MNLQAVKDAATDQNFRQIANQLSSGSRSYRPVFSIADYKAQPETDATGAINRALEEAAGNGPVFIPPNRYRATNIEIPSNTEMFGTGWQSVIQVPESSAHPYCLRNKDTTNGNSNISLHDFAIDGNKANAGGTAECQIIITAQDPHLCENIWVDRIYSPNASKLGIVFVNCQNYSAMRNLCMDHGRDGITSYYNCQNGVIANNRMIRCNDDSIGLNAENGESSGHVMRNIDVFGNVIAGPAPNKGSYGAITVRGTRSINIVGNAIQGNKQYGILAVDFNSSAVGDLLIANNTLMESGAGGEGLRGAIMLYAGASGSAGINDVTIIGNHIREPATHGIHLQNDEPAINGVQHVNIIGNFIDRAGENGIHLNDSVMREITIHGNFSHDNAGYGISALTFANRLQGVRINHNTVFNNGGPGIHAHGIVGGTLIGNSSFNQVASTPQTYGVRATSLAGRWHFADNSAINNATANYDYSALGGATFVNGFFDKAPIAKPAGVPETAAGIHKALKELGLIS